MTKTTPHDDSKMTRKMSFSERIKAYAQNMSQRRSRGKMSHPVIDPKTFKPYPTTYRYGVKSSSHAAGYHTGEDHACPEGSLALATSWGTVEYAGPASARWGSAYGNQVIVRTADGKYDYAHNHLSEISCSAGVVVFPGKLLGLTGSTGNVTGPHTHFEARVAGGRYGSDVHPMLVKRKK